MLILMQQRSRSLTAHLRQASGSGFGMTCRGGG